MKINKIQKEIFAAMLRDDKVHFCKVSESETAFTYDGQKGFIIPDKLICFNMAKAIEADQMKGMFEKKEDDRLLILTDELEKVAGERFCRKLICQPGESIQGPVKEESRTEIWVNAGFLEYFRDLDYTQFYAYKSRDRILVSVGNKNQKICAALMPFRVGIEN